MLGCCCSASPDRSLRLDAGGSDGNFLTLLGTDCEEHNSCTNNNALARWDQNLDTTFFLFGPINEEQRLMFTKFVLDCVIYCVTMPIVI